MPRRCSQEPFRKDIGELLPLRAYLGKSLAHLLFGCRITLVWRLGDGGHQGLVESGGLYLKVLILAHEFGQFTRTSGKPLRELVHRLCRCGRRRRLQDLVAVVERLCPVDQTNLLRAHQDWKGGVVKEKTPLSHSADDRQGIAIATLRIVKPRQIVQG